MPVPTTDPFAHIACGGQFTTGAANLGVPTTLAAQDRHNYRYGALAIIFFTPPVIPAGAEISMEYQLQSAADLGFTQNVEDVPGATGIVPMAVTGATPYTTGAGFCKLMPIRNFNNTRNRFVRLRLTPRGSGYTGVGVIIGTHLWSGAPVAPEPPFQLTL